MGLESFGRGRIAAALVGVTATTLGGVGVPGAGPPVSFASPVAAALPTLSSAEALSPAAASPADGRRDLFWTEEGRLKQRNLLTGGSWGRARDRGGSLRSQPAVVSWGPGRLDVFARGTADELTWRAWRSGAGWTSWRSLGGVLSSAPTVASWRPGRLDVFVRWSDGSMRQRTYDTGTWAAWRSRGGTLTSSPAAASWAEGRIDVVARTAGNALAHRSFTTGRGWSSWRSLGGRLSAQPAVATPVAGRLDVVTRGPAGRMTVRSLVSGSGWTATRRLSDLVFTSGPGATAVGDDVRVAARRASGFLHEAVRTRPTGTWSRWRVVDELRPFRLLATWVDVLDYPTLDPATAVADMQSRDVRTLFLSTGRFNSASDFYDEAEMAQWLENAHRWGIKVVGWYVPAYGDMERDVQRTVAIADYVSPAGQRFDAVGVDIERFGPSGEVDRDTFNASVVPHLRQVRRQTASVIGAIVPAPYTTDPGNNWEGFPWSGIGPNSEVVVPMALWSKRRNTDGSPFTAAQVHDWVVEQIDRTQALTDRRVHVEGGVDDPGTEPTPVTEPRVAAFVQAVTDAGAIGGSHYDYATTRPELWAVLAGING
jgi:hypothetical protein